MEMQDIVSFTLSIALKIYECKSWYHPGKHLLLILQATKKMTKAELAIGELNCVAQFSSSWYLQKSGDCSSHIS